MSDAFYNELAASTLAQIKEVGRTVAIERIGRTFDPIEGDISDTGAIEGILNCIVLALNKNDKDGLDNNLIEALTEGRLRKILAAASGVTFVPMPNDVCTFDGAFWHVKGMTSIDPAGVPLLYYLIVQRTGLSTEDQAALPVIAIEEAVADMATAVNSITAP